MKVFCIATVLFFFSMLLEMIINSESVGDMGHRQPTGATKEWDNYIRQHPTVVDGTPTKKRRLDQLEEQNIKQGQTPTGAASEWDYYKKQHPIVQRLYSIIFDGPPGAAVAKKRKLLDQLEVQKTKQSQEESPKKDSTKKLIVYKRRRKGQKQEQGN